ncbi:ATP-binding cassette domain-containing protein [Alloiococcus sp. CFN-8]|uniref:ABC transporter ATP-binding protein n=1 Tax=Alloiococcus sp. CFN-8 TaxID=3416081 RepID=UPI003CE6BC99
MDMEQVKLRVENLTKYYGKTLGVKNLSLDVNKGEIFGFIGPNGAGKSTTIRCIMNLINKTEGKVYIDGELFTKDKTEIFRKIGYLPSEIQLYDDLTVREMIDYSASFYKNIDTEYVNSIIERLELDTSKKLEDLSLGNRKKLGIVLSLMHSPELIIMDEATSGLDPLMQEAFYEILLEERAKGKTIFFSSHNLPEVRRLCHRIGIIKEGQLITIDTVDNLTRSNILIVTLACDNNQVAEKLGARVISRGEGLIKFIYDGSTDVLISALQGLKVSRLLIEEPSLEEIFMHYYQ